MIGPAWLIALTALAISAGKLMWVESSTRTLLGCAWCASHEALPHEAQWLMLLWALHLASRAELAARWRVAAALRAVVVALLVLAAADLFVLQQFLVRLTLGEAMKFAGEPQAVRGFLGQLEPLRAALAITAALPTVLLAWCYVADRRGAGVHRPWWLVAAAVAGLVGTAAATVDDQHTPYLQHSIQAFFASQSRHRGYSPEFASRVARRDPAADRCSQGAGAHPDLILVMVESLSMYHSRRYSGLHDWTPELDRLSAQATTFQNFYANGVTSEQGLIALLTGQPPIERPGTTGRTLFEAFMTPAETVPRLLRRAGYVTRFISGFNLDFPGLNPWLAAMGFDRVEGQEAPFFSGRSSVRLHFDSVPDELLFERVLHELAQPRSAPLFVTTFTQSTHHPYLDPSSGLRTQEAALRYADRALGGFVQGLRAQRFFDNGYLLIVGDHRAMQPMDARERAQFGDRGFVRVPMTLVGPASGMHPQAVVSGAFSQTDLLPSLRHLVGNGQVCAALDEGVFLPTERVAPECVYTLRAYNPNRVYAHCGVIDAVVELDGDGTRYVGPEPHNHRVLEVVNRLRLGRGF